MISIIHTFDLMLLACTNKKVELTGHVGSVGKMTISHSYIFGRKIGRRDYLGGIG